MPDSTITGSARTGERDRAADTASGADRPEAVEARAREEVRTQGDRAREDHGGQEDRIQEALETAAAVAEKTGGLGIPGRPINRRSPFMIGMTAAFGVAVAYGLVELFIRARSVLIIIGLATFIAAGLDPIVSWLVRHRIPRWAAVVIVVGCALGVVAAFLAAAIPPLASEATSLAHQIPHYMHNLQDRNSQLGRLNIKYHLQQRLSKLVTGGGSSLIGGVLGAGKLVLGTASFIVAVMVLSIYFLAGLPRIKVFAYQLVPHSRRPRVILIGDEILAKVGGYVLGNFITSVIAGLGTYFWLLAFGVPYPILLAMFVALLDLVPVIGSTIGGAVVTLVALTVSLPVALATLGFYIGYRLAEDYLIVPRIQGRTVELPALASLVAVLIGGVLLGIVGALVAIPVAAAVRRRRRRRQAQLRETDLRIEQMSLGEGHHENVPGPGSRARSAWTLMQPAPVARTGRALPRSPRLSLKPPAVTGVAPVQQAVAERVLAGEVCAYAQLPLRLAGNDSVLMIAEDRLDPLHLLGEPPGVGAHRREVALHAGLDRADDQFPRNLAQPRLQVPDEHLSVACRPEDGAEPLKFGGQPPCAVAADNVPE